MHDKQCSWTGYEFREYLHWYRKCVEFFWEFDAITTKMRLTRNVGAFLVNLWLVFFFYDQRSLTIRPDCFGRGSKQVSTWVFSHNTFDDAFSWNSYFDSFKLKVYFHQEVYCFYHEMCWLSTEFALILSLTWRCYALYVFVMRQKYSI